MICQRFHKDSKIFVWDNKERYKVELGRKIAKSIWKVEREIYNGTSFGNTKLGQKNKSRSEYVRFYYKRNIVNKVWR